VPYDDAFYRRYQAYLEEPRVREAHGFALETFALAASPGAVIDVGCGRSQEYRRYGSYVIYRGIDLNHADPKLRVDYRDVDALMPVVKEHAPDAFVSLFSTEITAPPGENTRLYRNLFDVDTIRYGLVAGFYYASCRGDVNPVEETGGIVSWQTLHPIEEQWAEEYGETRITLPVPSEMFGDDVVEVWRIFHRSTS
jgi:hypothetical protein